MSLHVVSTFILVTHWLIVVGLSIHVIMRRPPVGVAVAWLAVILSIPFVGAIVYLLFGEKRLGKQRSARTRANAAGVRQWQTSLRAGHADSALRIDARAEPLRHHAERVLGFPAQPGNEIELLADFEAIFDRLVADIDAATETCHLAFYIWHEGGRAGDVVDALIRAAGRGVQCLALADAMGSKAFLDGAAVRRLRSAGVRFTPALPTGPLRTLVVRADLRNHRKIVVIDGRIAYTGSQNLVDPRYFKQDSGVGEWVDAMIRFTGPATAALDAVFRLDWSVETATAFLPPASPNGSVAPAGSVVQVVPSGPDLRPEAIHQLLLTAIYSARSELVMTTPYFVPEESMLTALLSAALRGVAVTLIVPARNDSRLVRHASVAAFDDLMTAGARIARFNGGLLHTKSLTIDGRFSLFGSVNLDMRSLWLNFEISLLVYDPDFTHRLRSLQDTYLADADLLDLGTWRRRPAWRKFTEDACRLVGPLL
jgi:cardiolipin synthase A/B